LPSNGPILYSQSDGNFGNKSIRDSHEISAKIFFGVEVRCIGQSINQSIKQSINQSINQSTSQSINQSINQPINQSIN